jgi:DNA processing protein
MNRRSIDQCSTEWPQGLSEFCPDRLPLAINVEGREIPDQSDCVAIVGTRRPTVAGRDAARTFGRALAEAGFTVVSGLALGIDTAAHQGALEAGGHTIAVLGCGLDIDYPKDNRELRTRIRTVGTLVTEYDHATPPKPSYFPARNRIVAGLSRAVLVVEGGKRSGAAITARLALEGNRTVFAVPGSIRNPYAVCPNELIRAGEATLVTTPQHIFDDVAPSLVWDGERVVGARNAPNIDDFEVRTLLALDDAPVGVEELRSVVGIPAGKISLALAKLEVRGWIRRGFTGAYEVSEGGIRVLNQLRASTSPQ